jgi:hypothetical protein
MVDVTHITCKNEDCESQPKFNTKGIKKGLYCSKHKLNGMIDVTHKTCKNEDCEIQPNFNTKGIKKGLYCSKHKLNGMVYVTHKTCKNEDCEIIPKFNTKGNKKGLYCSKHKLNGMINVINITCKNEDCEFIPSFNTRGIKTGLYCSKHKLDGMIDVLSNICNSVWCDTYISNKYDGYCSHCYINLFPDKKVARNYKTKEFSVVEYIKTRFPNTTFVSDKTINGSCSKRRPDLLLDLGYQVIIIEIDENQHTEYDCSCENRRIMEISKDLGHRPIIFIRFNPDAYTKDNKNISSCWGKTSKGICCVKKSKIKEWEHRLNSLGDHSEYWMNPINITNKIIEVVQLFY